MAQQPNIRLFLTSSALGNEQINCAFQDHRGYLWIGTDAGFYKHDGISVIESFMLEPAYGHGVSFAMQDSNETIWIGLQNGAILRQTHGRFPEPFDSAHFPQKKITCIIEGQQQRIWFGTYGDGLYYTNGDSLMRVDHEYELTDNYIYDIETDTHGNLWLGTDNGINILQPDGEDFHLSQVSVDDGLPDFIVQCLVPDNQGNMWAGMHENGICKIETKTRIVSVPEPLRNWSSGPINDLLVTGNKLCIATDGKGVFTLTLNPLKNLVLIQSQSVNLARVNQLLADQEENVWMVSQPEIGLSLGNKLEIVAALNQQPIHNVHALITSHQGHVWFGNDQGLFCYNTNENEHSNQLKHYSIGLDLKHQKIMSLFADHLGYIWIGTFGQGVIRLDPKTGNHIRFDDTNGLANTNILAIKGNSDAIWLATLGGATRLLISKGFENLSFKPQFENFGKAEGLSNNFIYDITLDHDKTVWFATDGSGVIYYKNGEFKPLTSDAGFENKVVYSVESDATGHIWMNVANEGLFKYDGVEISKINTDPDHTSATFNGILSTGNHELLLTYDQGIDVVNTLTGNIIHYEHNAGLQSIKPDLNTLARDRDGNVWIGTTPFIIKYTSAGTGAWKTPQTRINSVKLYLENIDTLRQQSFGHDENHFSFYYSGLWYQYPEKVLYRVKLEGHDLGWIETRNNNVIYSNLPPGKYTFRVKSGLQRDFANGIEANFTFTIHGPFWASIWFIVLAVLVLASLVFGYIKQRERNIRRKQEIIRNQIMFQYENLKSQINPHFLFNSFSTLIALIETEPEKAIEYTTELSALFRYLLEFKDKEVITLAEELDIAENYIQLQKKRFTENLIIDLQITDAIKNTQIPPLTLQLLIENALKHNIVSRDKPLTISINTDQEKGYLYVTNNLQLKKEVIQSTGIGIETIINRYKILTQKVIVINKTTDSFTVGIPIIYN